MKQKIMNKILSIMLVATMTLANIFFLGVSFGEIYAATKELETQDSVTNNENVEFDAYFLAKDGAKTHSKVSSIEDAKDSIYLYIKVKEGYLKNATVTISEGANFTLVNSNQNPEIIGSIDTENNSITLNQIKKGSELVLEIPIILKKDSKFDLGSFSVQNTIKLEGEYITEKGKTVTVTKDIITKLEWNGEANISINQSVEKYVPYNINGNMGIILQTKVSVGLENNSLPVKETSLDITVPKINDALPIEVQVNAKSLASTSGDERGTSFSEENWEYDEKTGKINIKIANEPDENNKVSWKEGIDEYILTYIYSSEVLNSASEDGIKINQKVDATVKAYNNMTTEITNSNVGEVELKNQINDVVSFEVETEETSIYKGFMYAGSDETEYKYTWRADIATTLIDKIVLEQDKDYFITEDENEKVSSSNNTYYKSTKISKANFEKVLGEDGYINIYSSNGTLLGTINKETEADENGYLVFNYEEKVETIKIETSKPIKIGSLTIEHTKAIAKNVGTNIARTRTRVNNRNGIKLKRQRPCRGRSCVCPNSTNKYHIKRTNNKNGLKHKQDNTINSSKK